MNASYHEGIRKLNLIKTHAHEIVGVKREQVAMVTESLSRPGTYEITVHRDGKVERHQWEAPEFQDAFVLAPAIVDLPEETREDEEAEFVSPVGDSEPVINAVGANTETVSGGPSVGDPEVVTDRPVEGDGESAGEAGVAPAPEAPRRRGRPKKTV